MVKYAIEEFCIVLVNILFEQFDLYMNPFDCTLFISEKDNYYNKSNKYKK